MSNDKDFTDKITDGTDSGGILGSGGGAQADITFDDESLDGGETPNDGEPPNSGEPPDDDNSNGNENSPSRNPFEEIVDQAIRRARGEPNRVHHIFENPTHNHYWDVTGLDDERNWDLIRQTMRDNQGDIESTSDRVAGRVQANFDIYTVEVLYIIIDGILRITDAWVIP